MVLSCGGRDHRRVRVASIVVLTTATVALIATQPWQADRPQRFVAVSLVLLAVLTVHLVAVVRLTAYRARVAASTLVAAAVSSLAITAVWILPRLSGFPTRAAGAVVLVEAGGLVAAGLAGLRTRDVGQAVLACVWSAALSSFLVFAGTLVVFALVPASVPDTQGRSMLPTATAAQRLAENRIEAPDGYLVLLALTCVLTLVVCAVVPMTRRSGPVPRPTGASRTPGPRGPAGRGSASGVRRR
jgi:hypothetical protein